MKICCIFNIAPAYRKSIFSLMLSELDCDMFVGDHSSEGISTMNIESAQLLKNRFHGSKLVWQSGAVRRAFSKRYDAYILTGNTGIRSNWIIAAVARLLGRKVYLWSHGLHGDEHGVVLKKSLAYMRLAGNVLLYGERAQKLLAEHGISNTSVIYNSLDYEQQLAIRAKISDTCLFRNYFGNELPTICYLGRLTAGKKLDMLLRSMQTLDCNLIIVGGGAVENSLREYADELGVTDKVWFYGESYDEIFNGTVLANCAVTVNPSSIGLTAIHSLMFGTPVITHDHLESQAPEAEVIVNGVTGYYYVQNDQDSLTQTIRKAIEKPKPQQECYDIIERKYNPNVQIKILKSIFGTKIDSNNVSKQ